MLTRTVGETIAVETILGSGLWPTFVDASQLENAIVNLVVNARDAMPEGGRITIETANASLDEAYCRQFGDVTPGQYVLLSVTDTGTGISPENLSKVFEPFFTTKDALRGHRARTCDDPWLRQAVERPHPHLQRGRAWDHRQDLPAADERSGADRIRSRRRARGKRANCRRLAQAKSY